MKKKWLYVPIVVLLTMFISVVVIKERAASPLEMKKIATPITSHLSYVPTYYQHTAGEVVSEFYKLGSQSYTTTNMRETTTKQAATTVTIPWQVDELLTEEDTFATSFLQELTKVYQQEINTQLTVNPATMLEHFWANNPQARVNVDAYQQGITASGYVYWGIYSSSGSKIGFRKEKVSGTVPSIGVTLMVADEE